MWNSVMLDCEIHRFIVFLIHARTLLLLIACRCSWAKSLNGCQGWSEEIGIHCFLDFVFTAVQQLRLIYAVWRAARAMCFTMSLCFWVESNGKQKLYFWSSHQRGLYAGLYSYCIRDAEELGASRRAALRNLGKVLFPPISTYFKKILTNWLYFCILFVLNICIVDHEGCRNTALACRLSSCKQASSSGIGHFTVVDSAMVEVETNERKLVQRCKIPLLFLFFLFLGNACDSTSKWPDLLTQPGCRLGSQLLPRGQG